MARNRSEHVPFPELSADIHLYYKLHTNGSYHRRRQIWGRMAEDDLEWLRKNWSGDKHNALMRYYANLHKAECLERDKLKRKEKR